MQNIKVFISLLCYKIWGEFGEGSNFEKSGLECGGIEDISPKSVLSFQWIKLKTGSCFYWQGFMMELTAHQGRVGNVLQVGSQLLAMGKLSDDEENEIQEQMNLLNSRWESLRVASMEKQSK